MALLRLPRSVLFSMAAKEGKISEVNMTSLLVRLAQGKREKQTADTTSEGGDVTVTPTEIHTLITGDQGQQRVR